MDGHEHCDLVWGHSHWFGLGQNSTDTHYCSHLLLRLANKTYFFLKAAESLVKCICELHGQQTWIYKALYWFDELYTFSSPGVKILRIRTIIDAKNVALLLSTTLFVWLDMSVYILVLGSFCLDEFRVADVQGNYIQAKDEHNNYGFMIGGHGMADAMCAPQYGFVYLDTTSDRIRLFYFEIGDLDQFLHPRRRFNSLFWLCFVFFSIHYDKRMKLRVACSVAKVCVHKHYTPAHCLEWYEHVH